MSDEMPGTVIGASIGAVVGIATLTIAVMPFYFARRRKMRDAAIRVEYRRLLDNQRATFEAIDKRRRERAKTAEFDRAYRSWSRYHRARRHRGDES